MSSAIQMDVLTSYLSSVMEEVALKNLLFEFHYSVRRPSRDDTGKERVLIVIYKISLMRPN